MKFNLPIFFLFIFLASNLDGQTTTIFDFFNLEKQDCTYEMNVKPNYGTAVAMDDYPSIVPPPLIPEPEAEPSEYLNKIKQLKVAFANLPDLEKPLFILENGDYPFKKGNLFGMKNKNGKVIHRPKFTHVYAKEMGNYSVNKQQKGFIGCIGDQCNYYLKKKRVLKEDWYYLERINATTFIIRGKNGYGVQIGKKRLIEANKSRMRHSSFGQHLAFFYYDRSTKLTTVVTNQGDTYSVNGFIETVDYLGDDYILLEGKLIHRKTKKMLICEAGFSFSRFHAGNDLFRLDYKKDVYLVDIQGNMIHEEAFEKIRNYPDNGYYSIEGYLKKGGSGLRKGLIDAQGQLVVPMKYRHVYAKFDYFIALTTDGKSCLLNKQGEAIVPTGMYQIGMINDSLCWVSPKPELSNTKILKLTDGKVVADSLPLTRVHREYFCKETIFHATAGKGQQARDFYVDVNFQRVGDSETTSRIFDLTTRGVWAFRDDRMKEGIQYYDCDGNLLELTIEGRVIAKFANIYLIKEGLHVVTLLNGDSYFLKNGTTLEKITFPYGGTRHFTLDRLFPVINKENQKMGLFDDSARQLLPPIYDYIGVSYGQQYIQVNYEEEFVQFVNTHGDLILENQPNVESHLTANLFVVNNNGKKGVIDDQGKIIVPAKYKFCDKDNGILVMSNPGESFYYTYEGVLIDRRK